MGGVQTNGIQGRVDNHNVIGPNIAEAGLEEREEEERDPRTESSQRARSLKSPRRRNTIKWPKYIETEEWRKLDEHLSGLLQVQSVLCGSVETKPNVFGEILYEEFNNRYGEVTISEAAARTW